MVEVILARDWSSSPLGPITRWPENLRTTVSLILASSFPINLIWGEEAVQIWNDAYAVICGDKHPAEFGSDYRICWASAWPAIGAAFDAARGGRTAYLTDQPMFLDRLGHLEETWFTFSLSPIFDQHGAVAGLFHPVTETTSHNLAERRTRTLRDLTGQMSAARTMEAALGAARQVLLRSLHDLPLAALYLGHGKAPLELAFCTGLAERDHGVLAALNESEHSPVALASRSGQSEDVGDVRASVGLVGAGVWGDPLQRMLATALRIGGAGDLHCVLVLGLSTRLPHDSLYMGHLELVAQVIASGLSGAIAYESERARAEQLAELDRVKTTFFSNVSHEFRTPLTLMLGPVEDELESGDRSEVSRQRLLTVHRNCLRLLRLVNSLLDFSQIEAGRIQANYEPTDLAAYTADLASVFRAAVERAGIELVVDCDALAEPVWVDRVMWEKIVTNLLSNAFKHTFAGAIEVRIRAEPGGGASLTVADSGVGIPAEELAHLFERFHRITNARSRSIEGTGIGLALVRELVDLHAGEVTVASVEGEGSTFTVELRGGSAHLPPERLRDGQVTATASGLAEAHADEALRWLADTAAEADEIGDHDQREDRASPAGRILVVDDNADMRRHIARILGPGFEVISHADGLAAFESAVADRPDLVLSDVMMPGLDGFGLLRALREDPRTRTVPVIMLSARAGEESAVQGISAGVDDYLVKPFSGRELLARVTRTLALSRLRRETEQRLEQTNRELAAATKAKSEFLANMSHEIRTPMNAIVGMTSLLFDTPLSVEQSEFAHVIRSAGDHLLRVVNDVLDFSRIEAGLLDLSVEPFEVRACVQEAVELVAHSAADAGLELVSVVEPAVPPRLIGDPGRLRQVLVNLLGNAVKFTNEGEVLLTVSSEPTPTGVRVTFAVRDTGIGISEETLDGLFDAFVQADSSLTRSNPGTGLGLAIARALTRMMGGELSATSTLGKGSTFRATIEVAVPAERVDNQPPSELDMRGLRVLIADDDTTAQQITTAHTRSWGMEPVSVSSSVAALGLLRAGERYDACLLDFSMPGSQCVEVVQAIRDTTGGRELPLVVLSSASAGRQDLDQLAAYGVPIHHKPIKPTALREALRSVLVTHPGPMRPHRRSLDPGTGARNPLRILIVEDQATNQLVLTRILSRLGYEADVAADGLEAIALIAQRPYDLVFMDIQMPNLDGYEATRRIRAEHNRPIQIIGVSAHASEEARRGCIDAGMDDYITKPYTVERLIDALRNAKPLTS